MVREWILYCFIGSIFFFLFCIGWAYQETIKFWVLKTFKPERLIKVVMHYPNNDLKNFWRLIPEDDLLSIGHEKYIYGREELSTIKDKFILKNKDESRYVLIDGVNYDFNVLCLEKKRFDKFPEIHYIFGNPLPIDFTYFTKKKADGVSVVDLSARQLEMLKKNDLFAKLLRLDVEQNLMTFIIIIGIINICATGFVIAKMMGYI